MMPSQQPALRRTLVVSLLCGLLLGPWVWAWLPETRPAAAQGEPQLSVLLFASSASVRPGGRISLSLAARTTSAALRPVTLQLVLHGAASFADASTPSGVCTTGDTASTCQVSVSSDQPAGVTAQLAVAASASGGLTLNATAQGGGDTASAEPVLVQITGEPLSASTVSPSATGSAPRASTPQAANSVTATTTSTPPTPSAAPATPLLPGEGPDRCEPNDTLVQPCAVQTETDIADLSFVDGSPDVFSVLLKGGRTYTLRAASTTGIDPVITVYLAGALQTPIASNDDAATGSTAAVAQVTTASDAWYILQVDNKAPGDMRGKTYTLSARSAAPVEGAVGPTPAPTQAALGDILENNYSVESAVRLGWGVPYDLSLVCPQPHACVAGDHDFFWVPVKAGIELVAATYDLGPGADTVATLYRPDPTQQDAQAGPPGWRPLIANDDVAPGWTLRSQVALTPDWDGYALLVVAPSERGDPPALPAAAGPAGRYRLIVGSPALAAVSSVLAAQADGPPIAPTAPTAPPAPPTSQAVAPVVAAPPAADGREVIREESLTGVAVVAADDTPFYRAVPPADSDLLARYPRGAEVRLLGQTYAGYVKVQPDDAVAPGWMYAPSLRPLATASATPAVRAPDPTSGTGTPGAADAARPSVTAPAHLSLRLEPLEPAPLPTAAVAAPQARSITIETCVAAEDGRSCATPIADVSVEVLLVASQRVVAVARTDRDGRVTLSVSVPANARLAARVAALGVASDLDNETTRLPILMPPQSSSGGAP